MHDKKNKRKKFLDKFTEEVITTVKEDIKRKEKEKLEKERKKREEEIKKLKEKFIKELDKIKPPKSLPLAQIPAPQTTEVPAVKPPKPLQPSAPVQQALKPSAFPIKSPSPTPPPLQTPALKSKPVKIEVLKTLPPIAPGVIDFGKIVFLVKDPLITYIECPGPGKNIIIRKAGNTLTTQLTLTKEEIIKIIKSFSEKTRIPLVEGMLIARSDNIEISAVVSEMIPPSFIIKKDIIPPIKAPPSKLLPPTQPYVTPSKLPKPLSVPMPRTPAPLPKPEESIFKKKIRFGK